FNENSILMDDCSMTNQRGSAAIYFFILSGIGLITAWYFNALAVFNREDYLAEGFTSNVDWVLSLDLLIVGFAAMAFIIIEGRRLKMKNLWVYIALAFVTAAAFTVPLFLGMRELKLKRVRKALQVTDLAKQAGGRIEYFEIDEHKIEVFVPDQLVANSPVLVIHDGKNVFDPATATTGATWGVLEALAQGRIRSENPPLIAAVWGLSDATRLPELGPQHIIENHPDMWDYYPDEWKPTDPTPRGNAYQDLLANKLLPLLSQKFGVVLNPETTAQMGASMAGLASIQGIASYPKVWGAALGLSTHWPFAGDFTVPELVDALPEPGQHFIWTDGGDLDLDEMYAPHHYAAVEQLENRGWVRDQHFMAMRFPGTGHNESYWQARVHLPINAWLNS
ncbi:MAG: hypothetical protein RIS82_523, partial [Actinomycetota bacterium]